MVGWKHRAQGTGALRREVPLLGLGDKTVTVSLIEGRRAQKTLYPLRTMILIKRSYCQGYLTLIDSSWKVRYLWVLAIKFLMSHRLHNVGGELPFQLYDNNPGQDGIS